MANPIKVLVVDDSVVIRALLTKELAKDPDIEVVAVAAHGRLALEKLRQHRVDLITLDLDMPIMNGVETMTELGREFPNIPVVIFSAQSKADALAAMDAMDHGAQACIHKTTNFHGKDHQALGCITLELIPTIKSLCNHPSAKPAQSPETLALRSRPRPKLNCKPELLVIGSSTGGPNAVNEVLRALPADFPVPILIVQHMPAVFTTHFAERLHKNTLLNVTEAEHGTAIEPGHAYVAPGNHHMVLISNARNELSIGLNQDAQENSVRPSVDVTLRSVEEKLQGRALTVILTGMGSDGLLGCRAMHEAGGTIIVQDEATSVVWGMPGFVAKERLAHSILPLNQIGSDIALHCRGISTRAPTPAQHPAAANPSHAQASTHHAPPDPAITSKTPSAPPSEAILHQDKKTMDSPDNTQDKTSAPVLLVDDSRAMRSMLKRMVSGLGLESVEAENGRAALEKIDQIGKPKFALVDWNMPEMNGLEFVKAIRSRPDMKGLALVMVTSEAEMERVAEALEAGADEYMMKPFSTDDLAEKLRALGLLAA